MSSRKVLCGLMMGTILASAGSAMAQEEQIGPFVLVPGQPIDLFFDNEILPDNDVKVLQFQGQVEYFGSSGTAGLLDISFDYLDVTGGTVVVPLPNSPFAIPPGAIVDVSAGPVTLPFCPERVSIHFDSATTEPGEYNIQGIFSHRCVPEPATAGLLMLAAPALLLRRRRAA